MALGLLAVAALASTLSGTPAAPPPHYLQMAANTRVTLRACNHTAKTLLVASSFIPVRASDWRNKGWTTVGAHACVNIFDTENHTFYVRAEVKGHSDQSWGHDIAQCVEYPGPYDFFTKSSDTSCPEGEPAQFSTIHAGNGPVFVWDLNP